MYALDTGEVSILPARSLHGIVTERRDEALLRTKTNGLPPHVALSLLQAGHRRFLGGANGHLDLSAQRRQAVAAAPRPFALVLTDADSRLSPEHLFDTGLGDLAVVRVAACMLDDEVLGSIEHAVREFGIGLVLVRPTMTRRIPRHTPTVQPAMAQPTRTTTPTAHPPRRPQLLPRRPHPQSSCRSCC